MKITKDYNDNELTLSIEGHIDTITSDKLKQEINSEIHNFNSLVLDFTSVDYISSAGLQVMIITQKKLGPQNIPFVIKNVNDKVYSIFKTSGFDKILMIE